MNSRATAAAVLLVPRVQQAHDVLKGAAHVAVSKGVDDGVDQRVALGQNQAVLLIAQHLALVTAKSVQQQNHQSRSPTQHKAAWGRGGEEEEKRRGGDKERRMREERRRSKRGEEEEERTRGEKRIGGGGGKVVGIRGGEGEEEEARR